MGRFNKKIVSLMEEWENISQTIPGGQIQPIPASSIEELDTLSSVSAVYAQIEETLLRDMEHGHLTGEVRISLNHTLADLGRAMLQLSTAPKYLVKTDD